MDVFFAVKRIAEKVIFAPGADLRPVHPVRCIGENNRDPKVRQIETRIGLKEPSQIVEDPSACRVEPLGGELHQCRVMIRHPATLKYRPEWTVNPLCAKGNFRLCLTCGERWLMNAYGWQASWPGRENRAMMRGALPLLAGVLLAACSGPQEQSIEPGTSPTEAIAPGGATEEVNLDLWLERLEVGSRELYSARQAVVEAVNLQPGDWVADIGAGTGLYSLLFAEEVGASGRVFAEDIEPLFLDLINRRTVDLTYDNVTAVLGREDDVTLPKESIDVAFIADTYHYFGDREVVMRSIYEALKPGGSLIIIEFDIETGEKRPDYKAHVRFGKSSVVSELEYVGFKFAEEVAVEGLDENYFVRFVKE